MTSAIPVLSKKEKYTQYNTMVCLVQGLEGHYTTVDLRNESYVYGKVNQVDPHMNMLMSDALFVDARGRECTFESIFVHARNIRYIHIPDELPIIPTMKNQLKKMNHKPTKQSRTFREKRLMEQEAATLSLIEKMKVKEQA